MAKTATQTPPRPQRTSLWELLFSITAVLALTVGAWFSIQTKEFQILIVSLAAAVVLAIVAMRPWRTTSDRGALALWLVGGLFLLVGLVSSFEAAPLLLAGAGAGFLLGLAAARNVYPKSTP